jgi:hypothetical protein
MPNPVTTEAMRAQLADTEEAVLAFAVTLREPDSDVHHGDLAWWLARQERLETRDELAPHGLL